MSRALLISLVVALVGCKGYPNVCDDYSGRTCIALEVKLSSRGPAVIDTVRITPQSGFTLKQADAQLSLPKGTATPLPILVPILPATMVAGVVSVDVQGLLQGKVVGNASFSTFLSLGDHVQETVELTPSDVVGDMGPAASDMGVAAHDMNVLCDPVTQSGCGAGSKCAVAGSSTQCVANGSATLGATCTTAPDDCVAGDYCVPSLEYCARFCRLNGDCPKGAGPLSANNISYCGTAFQAAPLSICTLPCNPVLAAGASECASGTKCDAWGYAPVDMGGIEYTNCGSAGAGTDGATCTYSSDCATGYGCFGNGSGSHCRLYCRPNTNSDCTIGGQTCGAVVGWSFTGACCPSTGC